jgi:hypothetical protein
MLTSSVHKILCTGGPREPTTYNSGGDFQSQINRQASTVAGQRDAVTAPNTIALRIVQVP